MLTQEEIEIVESLGNCYNQYCKLAKFHPNEREEFAVKIHDVQLMVMARAAVREYPDIFVNEDKNV